MEDLEPDGRGAGATFCNESIFCFFFLWARRWRVWLLVRRGVRRVRDAVAALAASGGERAWRSACVRMCIKVKDVVVRGRHKRVRRPGIEPGASRWQRDILPLNQRRLVNTYPPQKHQTPRTNNNTQTTYKTTTNNNKQTTSNTTQATHKHKPRTLNTKRSP